MCHGPNLKFDSRYEHQGVPWRERSGKHTHLVPVLRCAGPDLVERLHGVHRVPLGS